MPICCGAHCAHADSDATVPDRCARCQSVLGAAVWPGAEWQLSQKWPDSTLAPAFDLVSTLLKLSFFSCKDHFSWKWTRSFHVIFNYWLYFYFIFYSLELQVLFFFCLFFFVNIAVIVVFMILYAL